MSLDVHAVATTRLRSDGQRYTTGRRALVTALLASARPVTIPQLLDHGRGLAHSSVYRNLAVLERAGVVHRIVTADDFARYELAEDLTEHHHHHLICSRCGEVADFTLPAPLASASSMRPPAGSPSARASPSIGTSSTSWAPARHAADGGDPTAPSGVNGARSNAHEAAAARGGNAPKGRSALALDGT